MRTDPATPVPAAAPVAGVSTDIDDFIYLMSHDVRASVRALLELPQWIVEDLEETGFRIEGPVAASIEMMNRHTGRLDRMLVDLLTYSRVGRMQMVRDIDLNDALDQVLDEMVLPCGFKVIRGFDCDRIRMGERDVLTLFDALIQNAVKHHDAPSGRITVSAVREGEAVVLKVADDGPGVPPALRERVFGPMTTLKPRDEVEGSGMGLATVRRMAVHYGGTARLADSPFGKGSQIEVHLPQ